MKESKEGRCVATLAIGFLLQCVLASQLLRASKMCCLSTDTGEGRQGSGWTPGGHLRVQCMVRGNGLLWRRCSRASGKWGKGGGGGGGGEGWGRGVGSHDDRAPFWNLYKLDVVFLTSRASSFTPNPCTSAIQARKASRHTRRASGLTALANPGVTG